MRATRIAPGGVAAFLSLVSIAAGAQAPLPGDTGWGVSAGLAHRRLVESDDNGRQLVEEAGTLLRLSVQGRLPLSGGGALAAEAAASAGGLDYDGRTQVGRPIATSTAHRDLEATIAWRPWAPASWGEVWLELQALQQRRQIASTDTANGLHETSMLWMPGVRWAAVLEGTGWRWEPSVALQASARHRLEVRYGGLFDPSDLKGGRRTQLVLGLTAARVGSPWKWSFAWSHARQAASAWQPLYRQGLRAGNVRQPRIEIDDLSLKLTREF